MNIFVLMLTYGNRFNYITKVLESLKTMDIFRIVIVNNNSNYTEELFKYVKNFNNVEIINLDKNYGSALGIKIGLEKIYNDKNCDFIWILDDDNVPEENSLNELIKIWESLDIKEKEKKVALLSFRYKKYIYLIKDIINKKEYLFMERKNSIMGLHLRDLFQEFISYVLKKLKIINEINNEKLISYLNNNDIFNKYYKVIYAPYGGLFFNKKILECIKYPDERFYLYSDDHEWTYRITKNGGFIFLCIYSRIEDIDLSWYLKVPEKTRFEVFLLSNDIDRIFFSLRNRIYFELKDLVNNKFIYYLNMFIFILITLFFSLFNNKIKRFFFIIKSINEGINMFKLYQKDLYKNKKNYNTN